MATLSKPVTVGIVVVVLIAGFYLLQPDTPPKSKLAPPVKRYSTKPGQDADSMFRAEDFTRRFPRLKIKPRNLFAQASPNVKTIPLNAVTPGSIVKVPPQLADGDPNWTFTGFAMVDEKKMALLENPTKHLAEYAVEGQTWKGSHVARVSAEGIALTPKGGGFEQVVLRYNPALEGPKNPAGTLPAVTGANGNQPVTPNLSGPIGNFPNFPSAGRGAPVIIQTVNQ